MNSLQEYFWPLFISCKLLGIWPTSLKEKDNILDLLCGFPIHISFWYLYFSKLIKKELIKDIFTSASGLINDIFIYFSFTADVVLVVHNIFIRHQIKKMFQDLKYFEKEYFLGVKRRNLKLDLFIFVILGVFIISDNYFVGRDVIPNFDISYIFAYVGTMCIHIFYMFVMCEVLCITRNMFCRLNELVLALNSRRMNINYVIVLLKIHFNLTVFASGQGDLFAVLILIFVAEFFLFSVNGVYYCMNVLGSVIFTENLWPLATSNMLFLGNTSLLLIFLCYFLTAVRDEVSIVYCIVLW